MAQKIADPRPFSAPSTITSNPSGRAAYDAMQSALIAKIQKDSNFARAIANDLGSMSVIDSPYANLKCMAQSIFEAATAQVASNAAENAMQDIFKDIEND